MFSLVYYVLFLLFSIFVLLQTTAYGVYEITKEENLFGGVTVIVFTFACVVLGNFVVWLH